MIRPLTILAISLAAIASSPMVFAGTMDEEIDYLLATVGDSSCTFIRNGKRYSSKDAQEHLQTKRKRGKRYFDSADEFIERLASKSSMSGKMYLIQCGENEEQPSGEWFAARLAAYRERTDDPD